MAPTQPKPRGHPMPATNASAGPTETVHKLTNTKPHSSQSTQGPKCCCGRTQVAQVPCWQVQRISEECIHKSKEQSASTPCLLYLPRSLKRFHERTKANARELRYRRALMADIMQGLCHPTENRAWLASEQTACCLLLDQLARVSATWQTLE